MKFLIDTDACKKNCRDVDLMLYLISLYTGSKITKNTFEKARQQGFLTFNQAHVINNYFPDYVTLNKDGECLVESILSDGKVTPTLDSDERFDNLARQLRELYPQGTKPGTQQQWRNSVSTVSNRLKKFIMKYGEHTDEEIIEATKRYVSSFNGDYRYMHVLIYFIWKNKVAGGEYKNGVLVGEVEKQSELASYIENKEKVNTFTDDAFLTFK